MPLRTALIVAVILAFVAADARAQVNDQAAAEALFLEGRRMMTAKKYAEAAEKFAASDRADPSVGARINLGDCYQALGKTASAWSAFKAAANLARQKQDARRAQLASGKAAKIEPKLTYLILQVENVAPGQIVSIDGKPVSSALWGQRIPVDPGSLEVAAGAEGREPFTTSVKTGAAGAAVTVQVPALATVATTDPDDKPDSDPGTNRPDGPDPAPTDPNVAPPGPTGPGADTGGGSGRRYLALGVGAGGVVALGVGLGFGVSARSKWNGAFDDGLCDEATNVCDAQGQEQTDTARTHATISTVAVVAGAALVGAGVILYLTAPDPSSEGTARLVPVVGPDQIGVALGGGF